ncbi:MAG TPA: HAD-IIIA family hydrolase, partial [Gemmatimonadaceae bacterium]|nr:HAD-IIIA family hydrolase [Gemmatimonadaceae bacterium]
MSGAAAERRAAFLDRDGTLIEDRNYLADADGVRPMPNAIAAVRALNRADVLAIVVTNQSGIARGFLTENQYLATAERLRDLFANDGAIIDAMYHCPHFPDI